MIYIELKDRRSIYQFKEHHLIFKLIIACIKSRFSFIVFMNLNAMINVANINFDKVSCMSKAIQRLRQ